MPKPRDLQGIIFGVTEIAYSTAFFLFHFENWTSLFNATFFLNVLAYLTFIVFATIAFHQLSYKWLRTIIAFIVFLAVPAVLSVVITKALIDAGASLPWTYVTFIGISILKLVIGGCVYGLSVHWENNAAARIAEAN